MFLLISIGLALFMVFRFNESTRRIAFYLGCFSLFVVLVYPYLFEVERKSFSELFLGGFDGSFLSLWISLLEIFHYLFLCFLGSFG